MRATPDIPGYHLRASLGRGGMGEVFAATSSAGRAVALKIIAAETDRQHVRAQREIEALAALRHPGIVALVDYGHLPDGMWLAMERGLANLADDPPTTGRALRSVCVQVLEALAYAHSRGVLHRDLKPSNLVRTAVGTVCIADFGVARVGDHAEGASAGTRGFMAPEQTRSDAWDQGPWTDLYALGRMVQHWWPDAPAAWQQWMAHLTEPDAGARPCMAAHALAALPPATDAPLASADDELTAATVAEPAPATSVGSTPCTWRSSPLPPRLPTVPSRADRVPLELAAMCSPPLFGRADLMRAVWDAAVAHHHAARHVRVHSRRGVGATACLAHLRTRLGLAGVRSWWVTPDDTVATLKRRITNGDPARWGARFGLGLPTIEDPATHSLVAMAAAEPSPLVVLCDRVTPDVHRAISALGRSDLDLVVIDFGHHDDAPLTLEPLTPAALQAALGAWLDARDTRVLQVERSLGRHTGWLFRSLRGIEPRAIDVDAGLCALAWWNDDADAFVDFCAARGIPVHLRRWFDEGVVRATGTGLWFTDPRAVVAARASTPEGLRPHIDALLPHLADGGARGELLERFGRREQAIAERLAFGHELIRQTAFRRLGQLVEELDPQLAEDDPRRARWLRLLFAHAHHCEHDVARIEPLAERVASEPGRPEQASAAHYLAARRQFQGRYEDALAIVERADPEETHRVLVTEKASILFDLRRFDAIEDLHRRTGRVSPTTRGEAALMAGDVALAERIAREHLGTFSVWEDMSLHNLLGAVAVNQGNLAEGEAAFRRAATLGAGAVNVLQPLTNAAAVAALLGDHARAAREASQLLPRLEHWNWQQNIGWCCLVLWATHAEPDEAEHFGARARDIFARPEMSSQAELATTAARRFDAAKRPDLAAIARAWAAQLPEGAVA